MQNGKFVLHHSKQRKGNAVYIYYMIAWYYRKNKKPFRKIIKNLGRLNEYETEFYKNSIACLNNDPHMRPCNISKLCVRESKEYLSCAVGVHFWDHWNLSDVFKNYSDQTEISTAEIAKILTVIRFVRPCSKRTTAELYKETCLPHLTNVDPSLYNRARIFRELRNIEKHREKLGRHIFSLAKKKGYTKGEVLFYDSSSGNITGMRCVMAKWGRCKDGYNTHVVLLVVITSEGYPIYWEVVEGNTPDVKTMEDFISKTEKIYGKLEGIICFDRGMVSDDNLKLLEKKNIRFVTALDSDQIRVFDKFTDFALLDKVRRYDVKKESDKIKTEKDLIRGGFTMARKNLFYKEVRLTDGQKKKIEKITKKLNLRKRRYFSAFNPDLSHLTYKHRQERVQAFREWVEKYNEELGNALGERKKETVEKCLKEELKRRKIADVSIGYDLTEYKAENKNEKGRIKKVRTYKIKLTEISESSYKDAGKHDGLWMLITNISEEDDEKFFDETMFDSYFEICRLKNKVEETFRILSDFVEIEPFYVYKPEHIKAHFTICVLSYLLDITILTRIRNSDKTDNMDLHNVFHILSKCRQDIIQLDEKTVVSKLTQLNERQEKLLDALDCDYLVSSEYVIDKGIISDNKKCA
ncbi:MAG: transposase [Gammaproteobacteria bacterium]|nr:transposase [Gammaproteobacteria bacterium]